MIPSIEGEGNPRYADLRMAVEEHEIQEQAEAGALHGDEGAGVVAVPVPHPIEERLAQLAQLREDGAPRGE